MTTYIEPTLTKFNKTYTKLTDGSITYDTKSLNKTADELKSLVIKNSEPIGEKGLLNYTEISNSKINVLRKLVGYCRKNDIDIEFLLSPYHPYTYQLLISKPEYSLIPKTEEVYKKLAKEYSIKLFGSFNPLNLNLTDSSFYMNYTAMNLH